MDGPYLVLWRMHLALSSETHSVNLAATHVLRVDTRRDEMNVHEMELDKKLSTFWELESIGIKQENSVLETFKEKATLTNQRYEEGLPWREARDPLLGNRSLSQRRLQSVLKRLSQKPDQLEEYDRLINDQLDKGIIERFVLSEKAQPCHQIHYLPQFNNQASHCEKYISKREWASIT